MVMSSIEVASDKTNTMNQSGRVYALYKVYPSDKFAVAHIGRTTRKSPSRRWFLGYFRSKFDYEAEVRWLDKHEPDTVCHYDADEISDRGITDICDSAKFIEKCDRLAKEMFAERQQRDREYDEYKADLQRRGLKESDLPLSQRRFPRLFEQPITLESCYLSVTDFGEINWAAEKEALDKRLKEVRKSSQHGGQEDINAGIKYALRYID